MSEPEDNVTPLGKGRRLAEIMRAVKNADADREDAASDMRDAERTRLDLLAEELAPVIAEVPADIDGFDFAVSSGLQPRFWVDGVSHVMLARDRRTYRFVRDTRNGRVVLSESPDVRSMANDVTRYIAERMVERERMLESGSPTAYRPTRGVPGGSARLRDSFRPFAGGWPYLDDGWRVFFWALGIFALGCIFGFAIVATQWLAELTLRAGGA